MITEEQIIAGLLEPLAEIYPRPSKASQAALAKRLANYCRRDLTEGELTTAANRMIDTRKARSFPSMTELIGVVRFVPRPGTKKAFKSDAEKMAEIEAHDLAEQRAIGFLRGKPLAQRAIRERWAPALLEFATANNREPGFDEERPLIAKSRRNDVDARDLQGILGDKIRQLREAMHAKAERLIG